MDLPVHFGEWLRRERRRRDLTQEELAERSGCSVYAIRKIEAGDRRPSRQLAGLLARSFGIPLEDRETFIRVARGELNLERLPSPVPVRPAFPSIQPKPSIPRVNLPVSPSPLIGRETEVAATKKLLADPDCRLLTIAGMGGIGKTRLAVEAASAVQEHFPDGVILVELAPLSSPSHILPALADAMGFIPSGLEDPARQLLGAIHEKRLLLVMDNAEHLLAGTGLFTKMLESAPFLKLLVTSRERLNLQVEWVFDLQGLPFPPDGQVEAFEQFSSIALFLQRARQNLLDFDPGEDEKPWIVQICRILEGMPLGIELAAAWISLLSCQEIYQEIEGRLDFLASRLRDVPHRQRSLRATLDHSWKLLDAAERVLFRQLSVFRGGFSRSAAGSVAGATLSGISGLLSKSLITRKSDTHFDLHPLIQQYAAEKLLEYPDLQVKTLERHRQYFIDFLTVLHPELRGPQMQEALEAIQDDWENIRKAWQLTVTERRFSGLRQAEKCLFDFFELRDRREEGCALLSDTAQAVQEEMDQKPDDRELRTLLGLLIIDQSYLSSVYTKLSEVLEMARKGHDFLQGGSDEPAFGYSTLWLALINFRSGDLLLAEQRVLEAMEIFERCGDERGVATALTSEARVRLALRQFEPGRQSVERAETIYRQYGTEEGICRISILLGELDYYSGLHEPAKSRFEDALAMSKSAELPLFTSVALCWLSQLAQDRNDRDLAKALVEECSSFLSGRESLITQSTMYRRYGDLHAADGDFREARNFLDKALKILVHLENVAHALDTLLDYARLLSSQGRTEQALRWILFLVSEPRTWPLTRYQAEELYQELVQALSPEQVQSAEAYARNQSFGAIADEILRHSP